MESKTEPACGQTQPAFYSIGQPANVWLPVVTMRRIENAKFMRMHLFACLQNAIVVHAQ